MRKAFAADDQSRLVPERRTRLIDHDFTAIDDLFEQPKEICLVVSQADLRLIGANLVDSHSAARERRQYQTLAKVLRARVAQHRTVST